jgi:hypothetical protein
MNLLRQRGDAYGNGNFDLVQQIEAKINEEVAKAIKNEQEKDELNPFCTPLMAFITFEYTEARQRCLRDLVYKDLFSDEENLNRKKVQLFGEDMKMLAAWEPTDTIWENLGVEETFKAKAKSGFCFLITIIILIVSFSFTSI